MTTSYHVALYLGDNPMPMGLEWILYDRQPDEGTGMRFRSLNVHLELRPFHFTHKGVIHEGECYRLNSSTIRLRPGVRYSASMFLGSANGYHGPDGAA